MIFGCVLRRAFVGIFLACLGMGPGPGRGPWMYVWYKIRRRWLLLCRSAGRHAWLCQVDHNKLRFMLLVYDTSGCSPQGFSWSPSNRYLNRSKLASTRLCNNHIILNSLGRHNLSNALQVLAELRCVIPLLHCVLIFLSCLTG